MTDFEDLFNSHRVMVVLRGMASPADAVAAAYRAWDAGVALLEVPIGDLADAESLAAVVSAGVARGMLVGAGTVITTEHVQVAGEAGARYTVAPGFDPDVLEASRAAALPHLPGVATPSEVQGARRAGCQWVKVFPASTLGPEWFCAIRGPFPDVKYLATGGMTAETAGSYIDAGASVVALGASIARPERCADLALLVHMLDG